MNLPIISILIPIVISIVIFALKDKFSYIGKYLMSFGTLAVLGLNFFMISNLKKSGGVFSYYIGNIKPIKGWSYGTAITIDYFSLFFIAAICITILAFAIYCIIKGNLELDSTNSLILLFMISSITMFVYSGDIVNEYIAEVLILVLFLALLIHNEKDEKSDKIMNMLKTGIIGSSFTLIGFIMLYIKYHTLSLGQISALLQGNSDLISIVTMALILSGFTWMFLLFLNQIVDGRNYSERFNLGLNISALIICLSGIYVILRYIFMIYQCVNMDSIEILLIMLGIAITFLNLVYSFFEKDIIGSLKWAVVSPFGYIIAGFGIGLSYKLSTAYGSIAGFYQLINYITSIVIIELSLNEIVHDGTSIEGAFYRKPIASVTFLIGCFMMLFVPLLGGFVSNFMLYEAASRAGYFYITVIQVVFSVLATVIFIRDLEVIFKKNKTKVEVNIKEEAASIYIGILSLSSIIFGIFPKNILNALIKPAVYSIYNVNSYIDSMFEKGYAARIFKDTTNYVDVNYIFKGYVDSSSYAILLFVVILSLILILKLKNLKDTKIKIEKARAGFKQLPCIIVSLFACFALYFFIVL